MSPTIPDKLPRDFRNGHLEDDADGNARWGEYVHEDIVGFRWGLGRFIDDLASYVWSDPVTPPMTREELLAKLAEVDATEPAALIVEGGAA